MTKLDISPQHRYDDAFFDLVDAWALRSARRLLPFLKHELEIDSVVDVGCGRGAWLSIWRELGVNRILGLDGDYVRKDRLKIPESEFATVRLDQDWTYEGDFDLAQSLEVAEHLPPAAASGFVQALCKLANVVLFSAAEPGQGGEHHVNERPLSYWRELFENFGYQAFDVIRPRFCNDFLVQPWYRYNTLLFANQAGRERFSALLRASEVPPDRPLAQFGNWQWRLRKFALRPLPVSTVTALSKLSYRFAITRRKI